ncbi:hypothetical protein QBC47DRAFT_355731 [Echria macrotheca]|uniref:NACHT domain-containing protein n=1 Tax=Echria macrotheca TaxID=438768 RepID=A0AAJ0FGX9_9PEZI|nr:hypothetical protein QBC47DRAFT_355731 [Echria macrotheca]
MDPFTAIGLAGSIVTFVDVGVKVLSAARKMRASASGATDENESLASMSLRFNAALAAIDSKLSAGPLTQQEMALNELAKECRGVSDELLVLLGELKAKRPNSTASSLRAAWRNVRKKDDKNALEQKLNRCRQELDLMLSSMTRFDFLERLDELAKYGQSSQAELQSLQSNVKALESSLQAGVCGGWISAQALDSIRQVVRLSNQATTAVRQHRILDALRFDLMSERFDDVATAHRGTFSWLLGEGEGGAGQLDRSLRDWLEGGTGVFHISGKPGSGKSTLMKYLCCHDKTKEYLDAWASPKSLVIGKFFFWKPGSPLQKQLRGLVRGLLYSLLSESPDLIPLVFPKHWAATLVYPQIVFESHDEIQQAFLALIRRDDVYEKQRFAFFIDGVDEFEGNHAEMVEWLISWTVSRPENVKVCVSSREWVVFQEAFKSFPNLRLHEVTRPDIMKLVRDRLGNNADFSKLAQPKNMDRMFRQMVDKSDGVFLWVSLILRDIEEGLLSGDDLAQLEAKIDSLPNELGDLFWHLFNAIHPADRRESYAILTMALHCPIDWPLFRFCFLWDYLNGSHCQVVPGEAPEPLEPDQIAEMLVKIRRKIYGKAKGLLEVQKTGKRDGGRKRYGLRSALESDQFHAKDVTFRETIKLTHRSIVEFLGSEEVKQKMAAQTAGFDVLDALCQTFLAHLQVIVSTEAGCAYYFFPPATTEVPDYNQTEFADFPGLGWDMSRLLNEGCKAGALDSTRFCLFLDRVAEVVEPAEDAAGPLESLRGMLNFGYRDINFGVLGGMPIRYAGAVTTPEGLAMMASFYGSPAYLHHTQSYGLVRVVGHLPMLVVACVQTVYNKFPALLPGMMRVLEVYFSRGRSPNEPSFVKGASCWHYVVWRVVASATLEERRIFFPLFAFMVLMGGDPRLWLRLRAHPADETIVLVSFECGGGGPDRTPIDVHENGAEMATTLTWRLKAYMQRHGTEVSLRMLVGLWYPRHARPLQEAMDWMLARGGRLMADQRRELKERFEPSIRPLISQKAAEAISVHPQDYLFPSIPVRGWYRESGGSQIKVEMPREDHVW